MSTGARSMARIGMIAVAVLVVATGATAAEAISPAGVIVIEGEDLRSAGITRLGDIHLVLEEWGVTTVDGFTWATSPSGLAPYGLQQWRVAIDGKPVRINLFGVISLNRLPISISEIRRIRIYTVPCIAGGQMIDSGLIDFETGKEETGWLVRASAANETGDPGPYQFTELATPNVDRSGPDFSLGVNRGIGPARIGANIATLRHYTTDPATQQRTILLGGDEADIDVTASSLRLTGPLAGGTHRVLVGYSGIEDFFFFKPYGREIPAQSRLLHIDLDGELPVGAVTRLGYRLAYGSNTLEKRENALDLDFDWAARTTIADIALVREDGRVNGRLGAAIERTEARTGFRLSDNDRTVATLYGEVSARSATRLSTVGVVLATNEDDVVPSGFLAVRWASSAGNLVTGFHASYLRRLPEQDQRIWFWDERGYSFLEDNGVPVSRFAGLVTTQTLTVDLFCEKRFGGGTTLELRGLYRDFADLLLEEQAFQYDRAGRSFSGPVRLRSGQRGHLAGGQAALRFALAGNVKGRFLYRYQAEVGGDGAFQDNWNTVPKSHVRLVVDFRAAKNLSLWGTLYFWSGTTWADYRVVDWQSGGFYRSSVDDVLAIDAAIQKWFWNRRARANLGFRNILDGVNRYHPIGASFDLTAFLQVEVLLPPILHRR